MCLFSIVENEFLNPEIKYQANCMTNDFFVNFPKKENLYYDITAFATKYQYCPSAITENNSETYSIKIPYNGCGTSVCILQPQLFL